MKTTRLLCSILALAALSGFPAYARDLTVAENGHSDYVIVRPETPTAVDDFAVDELSKFLKQSTGSDFAVESPDKITESQKKIFVGLSGPALKVLGEDPLKEMEDQEHVARSAGDDIFLYGKGLHGNLNAVYEFLENSVGCRWYSAFGGMNIPGHETLRLAEFNRRTRFAFRYRTMVTARYFLLEPEPSLFLYRNRFNLGLEEGAKVKGVADALKMIPPEIHTLFCYLPPHETPKPGFNPPLDFLTNKNYFKSNPEFFSMDEKGARVDDRQLCFSNKELRRTLTANVEENLKRNGGRGIVAVEVNDAGGPLCCCPECQKLEKQYSAPGGPMFDYLLELCGELKEKFPEAQVMTFAYTQTLTPPQHVEGLPDNLIMIFAPLIGNFAADWNDPLNAETLRDLTQWCKLSRNVWVWYYTDPYVRGLADWEPIPPFGNIERLVNDIRIMKKAGVAGMYFEHDVGQNLGDGFYQLQTYLMVKLFQNPEADSSALVSEFMALQYGQAAASMKSYLDELEGLCKKMGAISSGPSPWTFFQYLTPERLARWEGDFDRMEQSVTNDPQSHFNVQLVRVGLDLAVLRDWQKVQKAFPDLFKDAKPIATRVRAVYERAGREHASPGRASEIMNAKLAGLYASLDALMLSSVEKPNLLPAGKPLPDIFAGIASDRIIRVVVSADWTGSSGGVKDADAAFGVAGECLTNGPFPFGLYDATTGKSPVQRTLQPSEIKPGAYKMYKLGTAELTPDCYVWLSSTWQIQSKLDKFCEPGAASRYEIYASMKFEGPSYEKDSKLKEDRFRCDQIVLVKKDPGFIR